MKKRTISFCFSLALAAGAIATAVPVPAEVIDNLDFFSDFELLTNLEILENEPGENVPVAVSTAAAVPADIAIPDIPAVSTAAAVADVSTGTIKISAPVGRSYEKH